MLRLSARTTYAQVDQWLGYIDKEVVMGSNLEAVLSALNKYLAFRSYMIGSDLTVADLMLWGQLQGEAPGRILCKPGSQRPQG